MRSLYHCAPPLSRAWNITIKDVKKHWSLVAAMIIIIAGVIAAMVLEKGGILFVIGIVLSTIASVIIARSDHFQSKGSKGCKTIVRWSQGIGGLLNIVPLYLVPIGVLMPLEVVQLATHHVMASDDAHILVKKGLIIASVGAAISMIVGPGDMNGKTVYWARVPSSRVVAADSATTGDADTFYYKIEDNNVTVDRHVGEQRVPVTMPSSELQALLAPGFSRFAASTRALHEGVTVFAKVVNTGGSGYGHVELYERIDGSRLVEKKWIDHCSRSYLVVGGQAVALLASLAVIVRNRHTTIDATTAITVGLALAASAGAMLTVHCSAIFSQFGDHFNGWLFLLETGLGVGGTIAWVVGKGKLLSMSQAPMGSLLAGGFICSSMTMAALFHRESHHVRFREAEYVYYFLGIPLMALGTACMFMGQLKDFEKSKTHAL